MPRSRLSVLLSLLLLGLVSRPVSAQTPTPPPGPVYLVQEGDTLWDIAIRFRVGLADLLAVNNLSGGEIYVSQPLVIPGLEDLSGTLVTTQVPFGETLRSLARRYQMDEDLLRRLNHLVTPAELYAGAELILLEQPEQPAWTARDSLSPGESVLELAVRQGTDPWTVAAINRLQAPSLGLPGDIFSLPGGTPGAAAGGLPAAITSAQIDPLPLTQGRTVQIKLTTDPAAQLSGSLAGYRLNFFPQEGTTQVALQAMHAMLEPGIYPFSLAITLPGGEVQSFEQMVMVVAGNYPSENISGVDESTLDPAVTEPENAWLLSVVSPVTPTRLWEGVFQLPVDSQYCVRSFFGNRRNYNGGELYSFHSGADFGVCSDYRPFDIYAPAAGRVVYTGSQTVRGNVTILDHGWGIYSGYYHQEEIYVLDGEAVIPGQLIGKMGETGRVTGTHLHWEIWVNGVQADPLQWLDTAFPH